MRFFGLFWLVEGFQAYCFLLWTAANLQFSRHDPLLSSVKVCYTTFARFRQIIRPRDFTECAVGWMGNS